MEKAERSDIPDIDKKKLVNMLFLLGEWFMFNLSFFYESTPLTAWKLGSCMEMSILLLDFISVRMNIIHIVIKVRVEYVN